MQLPAWAEHHTQKDGQSWFWEIDVSDRPFESSQSALSNLGGSIGGPQQTNRGRAQNEGEGRNPQSEEGGRFADRPLPEGFAYFTLAVGGVAFAGSLLVFYWLGWLR